MGPELKKVIGKTCDRLSIKILPSGKIIRILDDDVIDSHNNSNKNREGGSVKDILMGTPHKNLRTSGSLIKLRNNRFRYIINLYGTKVKYSETK